MKFDEKTIAGGVEILAADDFKAVPITLAATTGTIYAGTPLNASGEDVLAGTSAVGILLYDAEPAKNPNVAMVVEGVIDYNKIVAHASVTATAAALHTLIPAIYFREDIPGVPNA